MLYSAVNKPAQILPHTSYMVCSVIPEIFQELCFFDDQTVAKQNPETISQVTIGALNFAPPIVVWKDIQWN